MASVNGTVTITHHGLREKIVFEKSYPLVHALEVYCKKYGLDPAKYQLLSGRTAVDLGTPFQFSSVPNNALLELDRKSGVVDTSAAEVRIAIERSGAARLESSFLTTATLADVILSFIRSGDIAGYDDTTLLDSNFDGVTVVYVRRQVKGADLAKTTLSSLGALKGAAVLRLNMPPPTSSSTAITSAVAGTSNVAPSPVEMLPASVTDVAAETATPLVSVTPSSATNDMISAPATTSNSESVEAPVASGHSTTTAIDALATSSIQTESNHVKRPRTQSPTHTAQTAAATTATVTTTTTVASAGGSSGKLKLQEAALYARKAMERLRAVNFDAESKAALLTIVKILDNLLRAPGDVRVRTLRFGNAKFVEAVGRHPAAVDILRTSGFSDVTNPASGERVLQMGDEEDVDRIQIVREVIEAELRGMGADVPPAPSVADYFAMRNAQREEAARLVESFDPYRTNVLRMQPVAETAAEETASKAVPDSAEEPMTTTERKVADLRARAAALQAAHRPKDRATRVFLPNATSSAAPSAGADADDVRESTADDDESEEGMRLMAEYAKRKMAEFSTDKAMKTQAQRELEILQAAKVFTQAVIRVEMPDRTVLQGTFSPLDTVAQVHSWLQSLLKPDLPFFIYSTPPTLEHKPSDDTLHQVRFSPAKLLRLGWGSGLASKLPPTEAPNDPSLYLRQDVYNAALSGAAVADSTTSVAAGMVDLLEKPSAAAGVSEQDLDAMADMLLRGENPFAAAPRAAANAKSTGSKGKPSWLKL